MITLNALVSIVISFVFLIIVFVPMEKVFPAKPNQKFFRPHWFLDLCFFLGQYLVWSAMVLWILNFVQPYFMNIIPNLWHKNIQSQPWVLQALEVIVLSDFFIYWAHRLQHKVDFLWRFHKIHHSVQHMDWLAAHREHPIDTIYTVGIINLPAIILGFPLSTIISLIAFRGIWAIYIHSNVRLNIGFLKKIIGSPELHHWHHDIERDRGNYANISPIMDILFGTYTAPNHEPKQFGIKEDLPQNYLAQMILPLLPKFKRK